jgi:hypothetical protein
MDLKYLRLLEEYKYTVIFLDDWQVGTSLSEQPVNPIITV